MEAPELKKGTRAAVQVVPYFDDDGSTVGVVIVKERFTVDRGDRVHRTNDAEIRLVDDPYDPEKPEASSTRYPSDLCVRKPSTDVLVVGSCVAPYQRRVPTLDLRVVVGAIDRTLRVFGTRVWEQTLLGGLAPSAPLPFESVPVKWELAFGGADYEDPRGPVEEPRNPVGTGLVRDASKLLHKPVPQIEDPRDLITSARSRPAPAGLGAIARHWTPRRSYAGTYDETWKRERMPLPPLDLDPRFYQCAPPEQVSPAPLRGGEPVVVENMSEGGSLRFELPRLHFFVGARTDEGLREHAPVLDTVLIEPGERRVELTWRAAVPLPKRARALHYVQVHEKERRA